MEQQGAAALLLLYAAGLFRHHEVARCWRLPRWKNPGCFSGQGLLFLFGINYLERWDIFGSPQNRRRGANVHAAHLVPLFPREGRCRWAAIVLTQLRWLRWPTFMRCRPRLDEMLTTRTALRLAPFPGFPLKKQTAALKSGRVRCKKRAEHRREYPVATGVTLVAPSDNSDNVGLE